MSLDRVAVPHFDFKEEASEGILDFGTLLCDFKRADCPPILGGSVRIAISETITELTKLTEVKRVFASTEKD